MRRVVVTGLGAVTPLGVGWKQTWARLLASNCGIVKLHPEVYHHDITRQQCRIAGLVPEDEWAMAQAMYFSPNETRRMPKFMRYSLVAAKEALEDASWLPGSPIEQDKTGICLGSGIGSIETVYDASLSLHFGGSKKVSPFFVPSLLINLAAGHVSIKFGLKGPSHAVTTACTTGSHAIGDAARFISSGDANVMVAGGAESCIHPLAFAGFERSRSLTTVYNDNPKAASRPFDEARDGFVIGEGAAVLVLEEMQHALSRGARIYAELKGYGTSSDAHHLTAPPTNGEGALRAMQKALKHAGISPSQVDYINAHAASTKIGDAAEARAIQSLVASSNREQCPKSVSISSTKGAIGHLLGAAGAVEALFGVLTIHQNHLPPTLNLDVLGVEEGPRSTFIRAQAQQRQVNVCLSNSFGFGGTNASLCFTRITI